jgi:hypothetical protein
MHRVSWRIEHCASAAEKVDATKPDLSSLCTHRSSCQRPRPAVSYDPFFFSSISSIDSFYTHPMRDWRPIMFTLAFYGSSSKLESGGTCWWMRCSNRGAFAPCTSATSLRSCGQHQQRDQTSASNLICQKTNNRSRIHLDEQESRFAAPVVLDAFQPQGHAGLQQHLLEEMQPPRIATKRTLTKTTRWSARSISAFSRLYVGSMILHGPHQSLCASTTF